MISSYFHYQDAVWSNKYGNKENVSGDGGGYIGFNVQNLNSTVQDAIDHIKFSSSSGIIDPEAFYYWPIEMQPGMFNYSFVYAKGISSPFREGDTLKVEVWSKNGHYTSNTFILNTPKLRIANVLQDASNLNIYRVYIRNDDNKNYTIDSVNINGKYSIPASVIEPGKLSIIYIDLDTVLTDCAPLWIAVKGHASDGSIYTRGAGIRVVEPLFSFGTWHSSGLDPENEDARKKFKELGITTIHGAGNPDYMQTAYNEYGLTNIYEPESEFGDATDTTSAGVFVRNWADKDFIFPWTIDDEPDLNDKDISLQIKKNLTYWLNDHNTPSSVNLAVQKKFNRYGWYSDIVGMDHYAAPPAPNIIALTWVPVVGRVGELEEALDYTEQLKLNTEPRRMWSWCQLAPGPWGYEQDDFALNIQFWMHVMGGAKSIEWFVAQKHTPNEYPAIWSEAAKVVRQLNSIKYLCFYGEQANILSTSTNKIRARALVGPEGVVIPVVNNSTRYSWNGSFNPIVYNASISPVNYSLEIDLPSWITPEQAYQVNPDGSKKPISLELISGNRYRILPTESIYKEGHIYVIADKDYTPPGKPTGLNMADSSDNTSYTLSWNEPYDNFGVLGYLIYYNESFIDSVWAPVYEADNDDFSCLSGTWNIYAFDASGNIGEPAQLNVSSTTVPDPLLILSDLEEALEIIAGQDTSLNITVSGIKTIFQWQYSKDGESWTNVPQGTVFSGTLTSQLIISNIPDSLDGYKIKCLVKDICNTIVETVIMELKIEKTTPVKDAFSRDFSIYPSPAYNRIYIMFEKASPSASLKILTAIGTEILTMPYGEHIDISSLPRGTYFIFYSDKEINKKGTFVKM